jgi:hypothetical protein
MNTLQKRMILFYGGCIIARTALAYAAFKLPSEKLKYMSYPAFLIACSFILLYTYDLRKTGPEVFGTSIWWNYLRPIHALFYFLVAYYAYHGNNVITGTLFLLDMMIGLITTSSHYYSQ